MQRFFSGLLPCLAFLLTSCAFNSSVDDDSYRPLGQIVPVNPQQKVNDEAAKPKPAAPQRYTADGYDENALTSTRYGHASSIAKVLRTSKIHCTQRNIHVGAPTPGIAPISLCHYQFPRHCGSHSFTLVESTEQVALVYHDHENHRSIVDQISDQNYARPGLWDLSDKLSVSSAFPEQQMAMQFRENQWREWVVDMNSEDRIFFGTAYAKAINEVQACF